MPTLFTGEHVIWKGQPGAGFVWRPIELFLIPFSLFWAGFALFWNVSVWQTNAPIEFKLFGLPFLVMGLWIIGGRFIMDRWLRSRTRYFLTDRRVIVARPLGRSERSLQLSRLPVLELETRADGRGTIRFESDQGLMFRGNGFGIWSPSLGGPLQFTQIDDVRRVYDLISRTTNA
jgi:hypothetical protein